MSQRYLMVLNILMVLAIICVLNWSGASDYEDAKRMEQAYCEGVKDGWHPAYKGKAGCKTGKH